MTIRIFVGSDERSDVCDAVLEHSIRKHCSTDVEITFMRASEPGLWHDWRSGPEWYTRFSGFRFTVPEAAGFEGHAIYLDSDMMVHQDIAQICPPPKNRGPWWSINKHRLCVSVIDCAAFKGLRWWPTIASMRDAGLPLQYYRGLMQARNFIDGSLPTQWNTFDQYRPGRTALTHFTHVPSQPWKPWPERVKYVAHKDPAAVKEFWRLAEEAGCQATP